MQRISSKGNPWHDERGRFCHGPRAVSKSEQSDYSERTEQRKRQHALNEQFNSLMVKDTITQEEVNAYIEEKKKDPQYRKALDECYKRGEAYNEVAVPFEKRMTEYDEAIDRGEKPNGEGIREESAKARRLYEEYKKADIEASKHEKDLKALNEKLAVSEGQNPMFYSNGIPRPYTAMVTMPYSGPHEQKGFTDELTDESSKEYQMTLNEASALRGESREETEKRFREILNGSDKEAYERAFRQLYTEKRGELLSLDLETNSLSPAQGNIIEFGCVDDKGREFDRLYSPTKEQMKTNGVGLTAIHNISKKMVKGHKTFEDDSANILERMKGKTIVVHNKGFELNWFRQQIPGFTEAEVNGDIRVVDTMHICQKFCGTERNRLKDFVEFNGGVYENAHRSSADAKMTLNALLTWIGGN